MPLGIRLGIRLRRKQPLALQQIAHAASQFGLGPGHHPRRNLFKTDFQ